MLRNKLIEEIKNNINNELQNTKDIDTEIKNGNFDIVKQYADELSYMKSTIDWAAGNGYLDIVRWQVANGLRGGSFAIDLSASHGYLKMIKWLYARGLEGSECGLYWAARRGYLDVVEYLYSNGLNNISIVIEGAVVHSNLEIIQWSEKKGKRFRLCI